MLIPVEVTAGNVMYEATVEAERVTSTVMSGMAIDIWVVAVRSASVAVVMSTSVVVSSVVVVRSVVVVISTSAVV
jgi:hypothetical protein